VHQEKERSSLDKGKIGKKDHGGRLKKKGKVKKSKGTDYEGGENKASFDLEKYERLPEPE